MTEDELAAMVENAIDDLQAIGRHWIADPHAEAVCHAVRQRMPGRTIVAEEPAPWDEWVIVDHSFCTMTGPELDKIAEQRSEMRRRKARRIPK